MTHDQVVTEIIKRAHQLGVLTHYCRESQRCLGDRGLPDLVCVGAFHGAFIEVKTPACPTLTAAQVTWKHQVKAAGLIHYVVGPEALDNGAMDRILGYLATGETLSGVA